MPDDQSTNPPADDPWVLPADLGEAFIRGGVHEPPARTREAVAKYGGQRTSWRHGGIAVGPDRPAIRPRRRARTGLVIVIVVAVVIGAGILYTGGLPGHTSSAGGQFSTQSTPATASVTPIAPVSAAGSASGTASPESKVEGITRADPPGTCYTAADIASVTALNLTVVSCAKPHDFELVAHELATGDDGTYSPPSYWSGAVARKCYQDLLTYTGTTRDKWPTTLESDYFTPRQDGWRVGDRDVYCLGQSTPRVTGTVKALT